MRIPRIYIDLPLAQGEIVTLPPSRTHYLVNVLRLKPSQPLIAFNGRGGEFEATLVTVAKKAASVSLDKFIDTSKESPLHTELAIGVSKGDRMDWIVQKATELGVNVITPIITERSEVKLNPERWEKKLSHWREIIINACEQSGRNRLPILSDVQPITSYLQTCAAMTKVILQPQSEPLSIKSMEKGGDVLLMIGPEGGFSEGEVAAANKAGFASWTLGSRILRTETAPVVALGILQHVWGDLGQVKQ